MNETSTVQLSLFTETNSSVACCQQVIRYLYSTGVPTKRPFRQQKLGTSCESFSLFTTNSGTAQRFKVFVSFIQYLQLVDVPCKGAIYLLSKECIFCVDNQTLIKGKNCILLFQCKELLEKLSRFQTQERCSFIDDNTHLC